MSDTLPDQSQRKVMIALNEDEYRSLEYDDEGRELLVNPEVHVQKFPIQGDDETLQSLQREGLLRPGEMLLQSPYRGDTYASLSDAEDSFAAQKYTLFSTVCMMLGATEVRVNRILCRDEESKTEVDVGASRLGQRGAADVEHERISSLRSNISLIDEFAGGEADVEAAEGLMREVGLTTEPNLRSLLEMARIDTNRIESRNFQLDLTREVQERLDIVAGLEIPSAIGAALDVDHSSHEYVEYQFDVQMEF